MLWAPLAARIGVSIGAVAAVTAFHFLLARVNPTTVALTYVVVILLVATRWGLTESTVASLAAVAGFNFFFLPPFLTWTIADSQNWVAFVVFLATAIVASQLSSRARERTIEAVSRQRDLERLYALSRAMLLSEGGPSAPAAIARRIAEAFELPAVALYDREADVVALGAAADLPGIERTLRDVARQGITARDPSGTVVTAIRLGGEPTGSLALSAEGLSDTVLQSIANLAAIGLERARGQAAAARAEAARQSGELRAAVLDALAHEFKTPLTSMAAAASGLEESAALGDRERELAAIVAEETDRLQGLVTDAVRMLRIDAGDFVVRRERHRLADLVKTALGQVARQLDGHQLVADVPEGLFVEADRELLLLAFRQLLDNAAKYSPPASTITVRATANGTVDVVFQNSGPPIPERDHPRIFERFYRGAQARRIPGTGMGLAIVDQIVRAHGGRVAASSAPDQETAFTISLPPQGEAT
jgi:two-component system sensor histidine kinase KdpD